VESVSAWLVVGVLACGLAAVLVRSLVGSALWLGATSALLATVLYLLGATTVAVVELSVGTGLVAVLFVFAIGIAGEQGIRAPAVVAWPLALALVGATALLLLGLVLPALEPAAARGEGALADVLWRQRAADVLGQIVLIVVGTLGVLTLLGGRPSLVRLTAPPAAERSPDGEAASVAAPAPPVEAGMGREAAR